MNRIVSRIETLFVRFPHVGSILFDFCVDIIPIRREYYHQLSKFSMKTYQMFLSQGNDQGNYSR